MKLRLRQRGFSLVELMIVVAIIGVLSTLAIQGVRRYLANAKSAEARNALGTLSRVAVQAFDREKANVTGVLTANTTQATGSKAFCATAAATVPAAIASVKASKYQSNPSDWEAGDAVTGWKCLKFAVDSPQAYMYGYTADATVGAGSFTASAQGDLDGDNTASKFEMFGAATNGVARLSAAIKETDPEE